MIRYLRRWLMRIARDPERPRLCIGPETRRMLDSGERHLSTARRSCRLGEPFEEEYRRALESFRSAEHRHPRMVPAVAGSAFGLAELALYRLEARECRPPEWTAAVQYLGRLIALYRNHATAYRVRAALYLAAGIRLREQDASASPCIVQARADLDRAREIDPARGGELVAILDRLAAHEADPRAILPQAREIRELLIGDGWASSS